MYKSVIILTLAGRSYSIVACSVVLWYHAMLFNTFQEVILRSRPWLSHCTLRLCPQFECNRNCRYQMRCARRVSGAICINYAQSDLHQLRSKWSASATLKVICINYAQSDLHQIRSKWSASATLKVICIRYAQSDLHQIRSTWSASATLKVICISYA